MYVMNVVSVDARNNDDGSLVGLCQIFEDTGKPVIYDESTTSWRAKGSRSTP